MSRKVVQNLSLFFFFALAFVPRATSEQFYASSKQIEALDRLYRLSGRVFPIDAFPVSVDALRCAAESLAKMADNAEIDDFIESLPTERIDVLRGEYATEIEGSYFLNPQKIEDSAIPAYATTRGIDFREFYLDRPAFASLTLAAESTLGFELLSSADLRREWSGDEFENSNIPSFAFNGGEGDFENHFFTKGILSWQKDRFRVAFGRDALRFSSPKGSSLYPSDALPFLDSFTMRVPFGPVSMDWAIASIHSYEASGGYDVDPNQAYPTTSGDSAYGFEGDENPTAILFAAHRFGLDLGSLRLSVGSEVLYARRNNAYNLGDFFPVFTWHNGDLRVNNIALILGARWVPLPGLEISLEAGYDDISAEAVGVGDFSVPTIDAYIAKATYSAKVPWGWLEFFCEAGYTHYLWGNFDAYATGIDDTYVVTLARAIYRYRMDSGAGAALLPLTSPYGPGALWGEFRTETETGRYRFGLSVLVLSLNTEANLVDTAYVASDAIENASRDFYARCSLSASLRIGYIELKTSPGIFVKNGDPGAMLYLGLRASGAMKYEVR